MDDKSMKLLGRYLPQTYLQQASDAKNARQSLINQLLEKRKWPEDGWCDELIESFLKELSSMDSNNFLKNHGVGEREARIASSLVASRNFHFGHGIGRSGDLTEIQPKAAGSSIMYQLTNALAKDALKTLGVQNVQACFVAPLATGMSLALVFLALRQLNPKARYIIWSRIDQKSCFKSITTAGFEPVIIHPMLVGDQLVTDTQKLEEFLQQLCDQSLVACVLSTTSCFAPRSCDDVEKIAEICKKYQVPHVINNAYGVQSTKCMHIIQQASRKGRVDAFIQSTDKNFMVPVGGAIIAGFDTEFINKVSQCYPGIYRALSLSLKDDDSYLDWKGRASSSPVIDLLITLLSLGSKKYVALVKERKELYEKLKNGLKEVASRFHLRVLETPGNPISIGLVLPETVDRKDLTHLGSQLFLRCVSGTRVVTTIDSKVINGHSFKGWGAHHDAYPSPYLTAAASIGMTEIDVKQFLIRLSKVLESWKSKAIVKPPVSATVHEESDDDQ